ncbi:MAG: hypothetical protein ACE5LH_09325 [Fidelibacterota bacterium]
MRWISTLVLLLAVAVAQNPPYGPGPGDTESSEPGERIRMMKMWKLTELLALTEDQAKVFFPRHNSLSDELQAMSEKQNDLLKKVDEMLDKGGKINDKDLSAILKEITDIEKAKLDRKREFFEKLDDVLTPEQKARYLVFEARFKRELLRHVRDRAGMESHRPRMKMKRKRWP